MTQRPVRSLMNLATANLTIVEIGTWFSSQYCWILSWNSAGTDAPILMSALGLGWNRTKDCSTFHDRCYGYLYQRPCINLVFSSRVDAIYGKRSKKWYLARDGCQLNALQNFLLCLILVFSSQTVLVSLPEVVPVLFQEVLRLVSGPWCSSSTSPDVWI